jgi:hypothetical protein
MSPEHAPKIPRVDHETPLKEVEQKILHRVDVLQRLSQKGCDTLRLLAARFEATKKQICEVAGDDFAFLDNPALLGQLERYEALNPNVSRDDAPIGALVEQRRLLRALAIFDRDFTDEPDIWE